MRFCSQCSNMYYLKVNDDNDLAYYCRNCGQEDNVLSNDNLCVSETNIKRTVQKHKAVVSEYTKIDPTLPRSHAIRCPNEECSEKNQEVLYVRYDDTNMKYVYMCTHCETNWKTDESR
jgi:DNA-directed RNA polymerase subunit M/transcription elongation factor TFIIS